MNMEERNGIKEIGFDEAVEMINGNKAKFVWLGREPLEYITRLLDIDPEKAAAANPRGLIEGAPEEVDSLKGAIFACYHGNTSGVVVKALKSKFGIDSYSLKGGVTSVVGEIF
ncbi:MAG: hypothetical protein QXF01_02695 [Candidatus Micrarchaeaceae archaeon]